MLVLYLNKKLKTKSILISVIVMLFTAILFFLFSKKDVIDDSRFVNYIVNPTKQNIQFYWKNDSDENFGSIGNLKNWLVKTNKKLVFATNGGMYKQDNSPQGLYIENSKILAILDTSSGNGNFYLKPNGIFYLTKENVPVICKTTNFIYTENVKFATQSGPMLVTEGQLHPSFIKGSTNINIRNGVGILPDSRIIFAMSKKEINFYDFASYFKSIGCTNALYLDGYVSRTYLPQKKWVQTDGNFGVIIGICDK
jgi:uncharacterized protein YigE (DUF2233 family)